MRENLAATLRLLLVTDDRLFGGRDPVAVCLAAVTGGVTAVQLRLKEAGDADFLALARRFVAEIPVPVFINDRLDIAMAVGAAGVHVGPDDVSPELARRIAPRGFIIGASVGTEAEIARGQYADYWGIGPLNGTSTKADAGSALGLDGARALLRQAGGRSCVVIGGVRPEDVAAAIRAGFAGVAAVRGILGATDVGRAAREYRV